MSDGMAKLRTTLARGPVGEVLDARRFRGLLMPMGDGPYPRRVWEPWQAMGETERGGITLGTDDHTELMCRVSGYLRDAGANSRRFCALWNAFIGVQIEEIEAMAKERSGWVPPSHDAMWQWPDVSPMKTITGK